MVAIPFLRVADSFKNEQKIVGHSAGLRAGNMALYRTGKRAG
jgi:hypothetical protein